MSLSDEQRIIKEYQPLIRALIPYEQQNKLLEGVNKFSKRLPVNVRKVVKDEVIRLTSITDQPADNSQFAQFPVMKFKHFGVEMRLDKVGSEILKNETSLYQDRYTVGVFESIMNSDFYQTQIKKDQFKKIVDAFNVETQSFTDIDFGDEIAITPNFTVSSPDFDKGRHCAVSSLAYEGMALETKRPPKANIGDKIVFTLPESIGQGGSPIEIQFVLEGIKFDKSLGKYESFFALDESTPDTIKALLKRYIKTNAYKQPLQRELEIERTMQDLERDRILDNSPWLPLFVSQNQQGSRPITALLTQTSTTSNDTKAILDSLSGKQFFNALYKELSVYSEAYVFHGKIKTKSGEVTITVSHKQLQNDGQLATIIYLLNKHGEFICTHCRLAPVTTLDTEKAFAIHDLIKNDFKDLEAIKNIIFCRDVSHYINQLITTQKIEFKPLPKHYRSESTRWNIDFVMEDSLDRRTETRYVMDKKAVVKLGLMTSVDAMVNDLSPSGMKLTVPPNSDIQDEVKVSIPDFKIKNERYRVVNYDKVSGVVRICLPDDAKKESNTGQVDNMVSGNSAFFKLRDVAKRQRLIHRYLWELTVRHLPSLAVLCVTNRFVLDRLKTVYQSEESDDLYPFSRTQNIVPMHGFFADKAESKPKSKMLENMLKGVNDKAAVVHCVRKSDNRLVFIKEKEFLYSKLRSQIQQQLEDDKIQLCVTDVTAIKCHNVDTPLTKKRFAQLSKVDKATYSKLSAMQEGYTHCIYLTNIATLHNDLVRANLITRPSETKKETALTA